MPKFYGKVGFVDTVETSTGVYENVPEERFYYGDITSVSKRWQTTENVNDDIRLEENISILADDYSIRNSSRIRYVIIDGIAWRVTNIVPARPRLILYIGGLYNGETVKT